MKNEKFFIGGMTCAACSTNVANTVCKLDGVKHVNVSLISNTMTVNYDETAVTEEKIANAVIRIGYSALPFSKSKDASKKSQWEIRKNNAIKESSLLKKRLVSSVVLLLPLMYISMGAMFNLPLPPFLENSLISAVFQLSLSFLIMLINRKFFISGFKGLIKLVPNMDTLVSIGSGASFVYSLYVLYKMASDSHFVTSHHLYFESAAMILTLVTLGKFLESRSKSKTSSALEKLINLAPKTATVLRDGTETSILTEKIKVGDIVVIRPGDTIPVDGIIIEGRGFIDQAAVTGESLPIEKAVDDTVICATQNKNGTFKFRASHVGEDTSLSKIINLVDDASNSKAPIARIADKVSGIFVPIVIAIAVVTAVVWLLLDKGFEFALTNAVSVLVISCPCALGLATPVAMSVGTGKAANLGILILSAESLENLHKINTVVLDKTGTITCGTPSVSDIILLNENYTNKALLKTAASIESGSNHPYATAICNSYKDELFKTTDFENVDGRGIRCKIDDVTYLAGNKQFMEENNLSLNDKTTKLLASYSESGKTVLFFANSKTVIGAVALSDEIRDTSKDAVSLLKDMEIKTVMLTGDNTSTANAVKESVGIDEVFSEVMPTGKEEYIRTLQADGNYVAMVGDGINDAPALARANVGIAIGAGTDVAVETADVVLLKNELLDVVNAIRLSKSVIQNIKINLFWAFFYNIIGIPIAAGVFYELFSLQLSPMLASAAMSLSSLFVVTNALRLRKFRGIFAKNDKMEELKMQKKMIIEGMMCMHCKANVEKTLLSIEGVTDASVNLDEKSAIITLGKNIENEVFITAITNAGYKVISCE